MKCVILRSNSKTETYLDVSSGLFSGSSSVLNDMFVADINL